MPRFQMTRLKAGAAVALAALTMTLVAGPVGAASVGSTDVQPFAGRFEGTAYGDDSTQAPLSLTLSQQGTGVDGTVTLGDGLYVRSRYCGGAAVPAGTASATGEIDPQDPNRVQASAAFAVQGIPLTIAVQGDLSPDGQSLATQATISVPAFCGPNPVLETTLQRTA
jgi:hypothetical protein